MKSLITGQDALKSNMLFSVKGDFLLQLFNTAEIFGIINSEIDTGNKLTFRLLRYVNQHTREIKFKDQVYIAIRNVMYILELYLKSPEFNKTSLNWCEVVKMIDEDKPGLTKLILKSEKYLIKKVSEVRILLYNSKEKASKIQAAKGYLEIINDVYLANNQYVSYINSKEFLWKLPVITSTHLCPIFTKDNIGFESIYKIASNVSTELEILEMFNKKDIKNVVLRYMEQTYQPYFENNLFELIISNYLFANSINQTPKNLLIDEVDVKIIMSEIIFGNLTAKELITSGIKSLKLVKSNQITYIEKMEVLIERKINSIKKRKTLAEEFVVTFKKDK